jgi:flagellar basal body-associated protein FliL
MPDKDARPVEASEEGGPKKRGKLKLFGIIGMVVAVKFFGGKPDSAGAQVPGYVQPQGDQQTERQDRELLFAKFRAMNDRSGQNIIYDVTVYGRVRGDMVEDAEKLIEQNKATIEDRLTRVFRSADPQFFKEPGLETLRRQIKHELSSVFGSENMVEEILLPSLMWYNAEG